MLKELKTLYTKIFIVSTPFILVVISFIIIDPFGVIHNKSPLSETSGDYLSTELYLKNKNSIPYNAFIFGNSKTLAFRSEDWKKKIKDSIVVFKYGCPGESIYNIYNKIKLIKNNNGNLKYALIILDAAIFANYKNQSKSYLGPVYKHHWLTSNESRLDFYGTYFKFYLSDFSFIKMIDYSLFKKYRLYMKGVITNREANTNVLQTENIDTVTNEFFLSDLENEISKNGYSSYYENHKAEFIFEKSKTPDKEVVIQKEDIEFLKEIKQLFDKDTTEFKIIIGPLYTKQNFPEPITMVLDDIFGKDKVFNFSGNNRISADSVNYYEKSHYRPIAGSLILDSIYNKYNPK